jgi:hypothetical protein
MDARPRHNTTVLTAQSVCRLRSIRIWLAVVILGLFPSGVIAFPLQHELELVVCICAQFHLPQHARVLNAWVVRVDHALADTNAQYPPRLRHRREILQLERANLTRAL